MNVNYQYASPSMCVTHEGHVTLGFSPDINRDEKVSFEGRLKNPLVFRDAMLMLRQIVISDSGVKRKERLEFFQWLDNEIERRIQEHEKYLPGVRKGIQDNINQLQNDINEKDSEIAKLNNIKKELQNEIDGYDAWRDYYKIEKKFWAFLKSRDQNLWFVLDPVITVFPDQVAFEAFSADESVYGCLSIDMREFEMIKEPKLGTTNIDFSSKLAKEMERFRTYSNVELSINPEGFTVDTGTVPEYMEKKIDLPETWIKGFNQVSSAANLQGISVELAPVDMYDICSFLRRHKENKSPPRYMKWILEKNKPVKIIFEPFGTELVLKAVYKGERKREEKIWGRRRWLVAEKLLPLAKSFEVKLLGFGMPQFVIADLGNMKMTIGFSSWSSNDWVKGTAFNIMSGFIGEGSYKEVYALLQKHRLMSVDDICGHLSKTTKTENISGIGSLLKRGEGYFDPVDGVVRFRRLLNTQLPNELYETTPVELYVKKWVDSGIENFRIRMTESKDYVFTNCYKDNNTLHNVKIVIDADGQITDVKCSCKEFKKGPGNISAPCSHILALYITSAKFTRLELECDREYKISDIMEMLL